MRPERGNRAANGLTVQALLPSARGRWRLHIRSRFRLVALNRH